MFQLTWFAVAIKSNLFSQAYRLDTFLGIGLMQLGFLPRFCVNGHASCFSFSVRHFTFHKATHPFSWPTSRTSLGKLILWVSYPVIISTAQLDRGLFLNPKSICIQRPLSNSVQRDDHVYINISQVGKYPTLSLLYLFYLFIQLDVLVKISTDHLFRSRKEKEKKMSSGRLSPLNLSCNWLWLNILSLQADAVMKAPIVCFLNSLSPLYFLMLLISPWNITNPLRLIVVRQKWAD